MLKSRNCQFGGKAHILSEMEMAQFLPLMPPCPIPSLCDAALCCCPLCRRATQAQSHVAPRSISAYSAPHIDNDPPVAICLVARQDSGLQMQNEQLKPCSALQYCLPTACYSLALQVSFSRRMLIFHFQNILQPKRL